MSNPTCEICRWWDKQNEEYGWCRRNPPQFSKPWSTDVDGTSEVKQYIASNFPATCKFDWCGEHESKEPPRTYENCLDWPVYWFVALERAIEEGDEEKEAEAQRNLNRLGVFVRRGSSESEN